MRWYTGAILAAGAALGSLMLAAPSYAAMDIGTLACNVGGGPGYLVVGSHPLNCTYSGPNGPQHYVGSLSTFGLDLGYLNGGELTWHVVAPTATVVPEPGMLSGDYGGVTGSAAFGYGGGANVLVGGSGRAFTLQPVSLEGERGYNVAAGIETMTLHWQPGPLG